MITAKRAGKTYEITEADQEHIRKMTVENGGDLMKAVAEFHQEKFAEPFRSADKKDL